ncbi:hypothetical protein CBW65_15410 [Tumebacillus avium]|uniref:DUF4309 domain-containing protein n=1 Tax=Tumebacillus avium TaxID=1903704 RepID=A0A1Y0IQB6_9BACL|nr:YjgB family protein [Tumebacillus avium]ARU62239.1 hypothetical protein CBW65_15410 [Tumebacillus avium]
MKSDHEPNWSELSRQELSREDRQAIWEGLHQRITQWEQEQPKRRQKRVGRLAILSFAATAAVGAMLFALPQLRDDPQQAAPPTARETKQVTEPSQLIQQILASAQLGHVPDSPYTAGVTKISEVEQDLGPANRVDTAGEGRYATYETIGFAFGFDEDGQVFDVRSYRPALQILRYEDVQSVLGRPRQISYYEDKQTTQDILHYQAGTAFDLLLIFPRPTAKQPNPHLHHISVVEFK